MSDQKKAGRVTRLRLLGHDSQMPPLIRATKPAQQAGDHHPFETRELTPLEEQYRDLMLKRVGPPTHHAHVEDAAICRWWPIPFPNFDSLVADYDAGTLPRWIHPADFIDLAFPPDCTAIAVPRARFKAALYAALRANELGCLFAAEHKTAVVAPGAMARVDLSSATPGDTIELETEMRTVPARYGIEIQHALEWLDLRPELMALVPSVSPFRDDSLQKNGKRGHAIGSLKSTAALLSGDANYHLEESRDVLARTIFSGLERRGKAKLPIDPSLFATVTSKAKSGISSIDRRTFNSVCTEVIAARQARK